MKAIGGRRGKTVLEICIVEIVLVVVIDGVVVVDVDAIAVGE